VLTPHPLEAARLLGEADARTVQSQRLHAAQRLAERFECTVLLKGSGSVIAAPRQTPAINPTGNARLASAGTGDVLAGLLAGLWSANATQVDAFGLAQTAAFIHGVPATDGDPARPLTASALIGRLSDAELSVGRERAP
jgi:NAD(P)H-hydrate repair Nnr-like enzyme with NAD(P)H-hydrate dehydratase domain